MGSKPSCILHQLVQHRAQRIGLREQRPLRGDLQSRLNLAQRGERDPVKPATLFR